jgi:peptidyl-prolyl cis-trans isomerase A (cyclophilin A)
LLTDLGSIDIDLYGVRAPISVCNFLRYVEAGLFTGGRFYRTVRPGNQATAPVKISVIQADIRKDAVTFPPIPLESTVKTGLRHLDGTISMARDAPDTASSSFFITIGNQPTLDFRGARNPDGQGFAAFGRVIRGMAVVRRIWMSPAIGEDLTPPRAIKRAYVVEGQ